MSLVRRFRELTRGAGRVDADLGLMASMAGFIEMAATRYALDPGAQWRPGEPLKLLFAGYSGTRNTGADARVEEMIRQVRHLLGDDLAQLSILTIDPEGSRRYFRTVRQLHLPQVFPRFVFDTVHQHHGVVACEGSMFKSSFATALSTLMVGALGVAGAENKIAVGYGGEAGKMDPALERLVARYCRSALIIARNEASRDILQRLGVSCRVGTDTAWTYEPAPPEVGRELLREAGWDGLTPVLAVCPINAFWWPVKPDLGRGLAWALTGAFERDHYDSIYFHNGGPDVDRKQAAYIAGLAEGIRRYRADREVFVVLVGMERLDRSACVQLSDALGGAPMFVSDDHDVDVMVSLLRATDRVLSSRYHAIVCSMPGLVPSAGVTMDERIHNLMTDRGTPELALTVDDPDLADRVVEVLHRLDRDEEAIREGIGLTVVDNLRRMGEMGQMLVDHLRERLPELPIRTELGSHGDPWAHLPPLSPGLEELVQRWRPHLQPGVDPAHKPSLLLASSSPGEARELH